MQELLLAEQAVKSLLLWEYGSVIYVVGEDQQHKY
jgi:hypothetical protein